MFIALEIFVWILVITSCQESVPSMTICCVPFIVCPPGQTAARPSKIGVIIVVHTTVPGYMA